MPKRRRTKPHPPPSPPPAADETAKRLTTKHWAWLVVSVAALVRTAYFVEYAFSPLMGYFGVDDLYYISWAGRIAQGDWMGTQVFEQGPLYAYLLASLLRLTGERVALILIVQLLSGLAVAWLVFDSARRMFDNTTAVVAGLLAAVFGPLVYYECMLMKTFLAPLLSMIALNATLRGTGVRTGSETSTATGKDPAGWPFIMVAGAAVGLACLIQEYHILLLLPLGTWIWIAPQSSQASTFSRAARVATVVVSAAICIAPCTLRNAAVAGEFVLVTAGGGEVFYIAHGPQALGVYNPPDFVLGAAGQEHEDFRREASRRVGRPLSHGESSRYWLREGLRSIASDPIRTVKLTVSKGLILLNDYDVPDSQSYVATRRFVGTLRWLPTFAWIGGLALVGMAICLFERSRFLLPLGIVLALTLPILIFYNFGRFRLGMMPLWILFAAHAGVWIVGRYRQPSVPKVWPTIALLAAGVISVGMFSPFLADQYRLPDSIRAALLAIRVGDYERAEVELSDVVAQLEQTQANSSAVLDVANIADVWQMMGEICLRTGRHQEGIVYLQRLRALPTRGDVRVRNLRAAFSLLQDSLRETLSAGDSAQASQLRSELLGVCAELRTIQPDSVAFWAISAAHQVDPQAVSEIERGLMAAWNASDGSEPQASAWFDAGRGFLSRLRGEQAAAERFARQALAAWPDHLLSVELRELATQ